MTTLYSVSDRKERIISQIMRDERLTLDRREQIVKSMLNLDEGSDQFILQDSQDPRHLLFPSLNLFSKQATVEKLSTAELKQKKASPSLSYSIGSENSEIILANDRPIFVHRRTEPENVSVNVILAKVKHANIEKDKNIRKDTINKVSRAVRMEEEHYAVSKKFAFQKKLASFRELIRNRLQEKYVSSPMIGSIMRCVDETLVFDFLQRYEGYTMTVDEVIHLIVKSLGSDMLPAYNLSIEEVELDAALSKEQKQSQSRRGSNDFDLSNGSFNRNRDWLNEYSDMIQRDMRSSENMSVSASAPILQQKAHERGMKPARVLKSSSRGGSREHGLGRASSADSSSKLAPKKGLFPWQNLPPIITEFPTDIQTRAQSRHEERDIEVATAWLSSVNKKLASDEAAEKAKKPPPKVKRKTIIKGYVPEQYIDEAALTDYYAFLNQIDNLLPPSSVAPCADHRDIARLLTAGEGSRNNNTVTSATNVKFKDLPPSLEKQNSSSVLSTSKQSKAKTAAAAKNKHIAVLPTVQKFIPIQENLYDFDPFAKHAAIPLPNPKSKPSNNNSSSSKSNGTMKKSFRPKEDSKLLNDLKDLTNRPISPYISAHHELVVQSSGVASGAGIELTPEQREKLVEERQRRRQHIQEYITQRKGRPNWSKLKSASRSTGVSATAAAAGSSSSSSQLNHAKAGASNHVSRSIHAQYHPSTVNINDNCFDFEASTSTVLSSIY